METADIGLIGLAVMGENLALNFEGKGYAVAVYNRRSPGREHAVDRFVEGRGRGKRLVGTHSIRELVESVRRPRRILMMIRASCLSLQMRSISSSTCVKSYTPGPLQYPSRKG